MKKKLIQHLLLGTFAAMIMTGCGNQTLSDPSLPQSEAFITNDNIDSVSAESHELYETNNETAEYVVPHEAGLDAMAISHEIDVYIENFTALYTNNTLDDTAPTMVIEEQNFPSNNDNGACLTIYSDLSGKRLRYKLTYYGETGNQVINYYLCENFVWISRQSNYYSSWILTDGYSDILYSEIDNWIVMDETVYIMHDNGELEKTEKAQPDVPLPETFTATEK